MQQQNKVKKRHVQREKKEETEMSQKTRLKNDVCTDEKTLQICNKKIK